MNNMSDTAKNNALDIAGYIINYSNQQGYQISNLKLQKLLYFVQAFFLASINRPCFNEEIEAWAFGPVVANVYHEFKRYGAENIPRISRAGSDHTINDSDKRIIEAVVDKFKYYSAPDLVKLTHNQDPWVDAYSPYQNAVISKKAIKDYFVK